MQRGIATGRTPPPLPPGPGERVSQQCNGDTVDVSNLTRAKTYDYRYRR